MRARKRTGSVGEGRPGFGNSAGRERNAGAILLVVETGADIVPLWPRWMQSAGTMLAANALVRAHCARCGALLRVELKEVVARHGPGYSLLDKLERCRMVGCDGSTIYRASRTYGREWTTLLRDPTLLASFATMPPAQTALDLRSAVCTGQSGAPAGQHPDV